MTPRDLARYRVLDFGESYQIKGREFHDYNKVSYDVERWFLKLCM